MLPSKQLKIADLYTIPIANAKNQRPTFLIKKIMCTIMRTWNLIKCCTN